MNFQFVNDNEIIYTLSDSMLQAVYFNSDFNGLNFYITIEYNFYGNNYSTNPNNNAMYLINY